MTTRRPPATPNPLPPHEASLEGPAYSYLLGHHGFIYACRRFSSGMTARPPAVLLLSADYRPFSLTLKNGHTLNTSAAIVAPRVHRSLDAEDAALLSFNVMPSHDAFHVFGSLQRAQVISLDRHAFAPLDAGLDALSNGSADIAQAEQAFEGVTTEALRQLPPAAPPDALALTCIRELEADPGMSLDELARRCGRSQQMMSRQFSGAVGISLRDYQSWLKQRRVLDLLPTGRSMTEVAHAAGFGDSPEFSRTFLRWYGVRPSLSRDAKFMRLVARNSASVSAAQDVG